jgi:hypothetical protein
MYQVDSGRRVRHDANVSTEELEDPDARFTYLVNSYPKFFQVEDPPRT